MHDVPASGVAMIPDGNCREAGAITTQCQGRRNGNDSVTVNEMLPPWACHGLRRRAGDRQWCQCEGGSDCKAPLARQRECRGGRGQAKTSFLQIPNCRTLALDGTESLQDKVGSTIIHFEGLAAVGPPRGRYSQAATDAHQRKNKRMRSTAIVAMVPICVTALMAMVQSTTIC